MAFEKMDMERISDEDLAALLAAMRELALTKNRVFLDLFVIVESESVRRHVPTDIKDYADRDVENACGALAQLVDAGRESRFDDSYPSMQFMLTALSGLLHEFERRGLNVALQ